jgi:predicted nuclease of predicted toxin-antitoxin system
MKLLVDVCLTPEWIPFFESHGVHAVHWSALGDVQADDRHIFDYAATHDWAVFTHDLDFGALLAHSHLHRPSVIQARVEDITPTSLGPIILAVLVKFEVQLRAGAIITVLPHRTKVRILPI